MEGQNVLNEQKHLKFKSLFCYKNDKKFESMSMFSDDALHLNHHILVTIINTLEIKK
jgi:hypothetical protein